MTAAIERLAAICQRWRGELVSVPSEDLGRTLATLRIAEHPHGAHALDWRRRRIYVSAQNANAGTIVHEMGHVFLHDEPASRQDSELHWLGWEICMARKVGCYRVWDVQNAAYGLWDGEEWGCSRKRLAIKEALEESHAWGYIDRKGNPRCTRKAP